MNNDRENDSFRTSTDIYGGMDTDYNTQYIPFDAEEDFESGGGDAEFGNAPEPKKKRKKKAKEKTLYAAAGAHSGRGGSFCPAAALASFRYFGNRGGGQSADERR